VHSKAFKKVKQSRKRLRFQPSVKVQPIDCSMTKEEKARSYYTKTEMKAFSSEVKTMMQSSSTCGAHASSAACVVGLESDPSLRGLEQYLCPIRVRNKVLVRKSVLKYHKILTARTDRTSEEKIQCMGSASAKLSQWSRHVAIETARLDSLRAFEGDYLIPINAPVDISPFMVPTKRRRVTCEEEDSQASKRRRS